MLRGLTSLALVQRFGVMRSCVLGFGVLGLTVLGLPGCSDEAEVLELTDYVVKIKKFAPYNDKVQFYLTNLADPSFDLTQQRVVEARQLLEDYSTAVENIPDPEANTLRHSHGLYKRSFEDARRLAQDRTGDLKRQGHSVAIGFKNLRRDIAQRFYPSIEVLLARKGLDKEEKYLLPWPFPED